MDPAPVIFDISSDDEPEPGPFSEPGVGGEDDHNWLEELLQAVDKDTDGSDDVVVVGEYTPPKPKLKSCRSSKPVRDFEDDDDCVILDGDPDKPDQPAAGKVKDTADSDEDELLVVGETGQVACRDYPHSRHLCLKFSFSSTLHSEHCELCHCYVCDSVAPCAYWGNGLSSSDHCHATDNQQMWKTMRENFRRAKDGSLTVSKVPTLTEAFNQVNQLSHIQNAVGLSANSVTYSQLRKPTTVRACTSVVPNIISRSRAPRPGYDYGRNGLFPRRSSQSALGIRDSLIRRDRGSQIGNLGQQFVSSGAIMKNQMFGVGPPFRTDQSIYGTSDINYIPSSTYTRNAAGPFTVPNNFGSGEQPTALPNMFSPGSSQPDVNLVADALASVPEVFRQPVYQPSNSQNVSQLHQTSSSVDSGILDFNFNWGGEMSNRQTLVEDFQYNGVAYNEDRSKVDQCSPQFPVSSGHHYPDDNYRSWNLGQSVPVTSAGGVPSDLNLFSPEPAAIDAGVLCTDFDTSWNGLTHN
ncbi:unnamed protein product [Linum trigynum]|uniref:Uncharacterized protein n=1 Tax=Linum trigynum TaxID=586398 RepID=A0AAV2EBV9_9ROSI